MADNSIAVRSDLENADYTFTDKELQEVLGFVEVMSATNHTSDLAQGLECLSVPSKGARDNSLLPVFGSGTTMDASMLANVMKSGVPPAGLQFQPHVAPATATAHPVLNRTADFAPNGMASSASLPFAGLLHAQSQPTASQIDPSNMQHMLLQQGTIPSALPYNLQVTTQAARLQTAALAGASNVAIGAGGVKAKQEASAPRRAEAPQPSGGEHGAKVSHGASEKQRRDRINAMIDELRVLIPPMTNDGSNHGAPDSFSLPDGRRSKYVVLHNTIQAVHMMQQQIKDQAAELEALRAFKAAVTAGGGGVAAMVQPATGADSEMAASPQAMTGLIAATAAGMSNEDTDENGSASSSGCEKTASGHPAPHVEVDMGPDHCYIKVTCEDRRGLLADILRSLQPLPLEISRAAITTSHETGMVTDIFEMKPDPAAGTANEVKEQVLSRLLEFESKVAGMKRARG